MFLDCQKLFSELQIFDHCVNKKIIFFDILNSLHSSLCTTTNVKIFWRIFEYSILIEVHIVENSTQQTRPRCHEIFFFFYLFSNILICVHVCVCIEEVELLIVGVIFVIILKIFDDNNMKIKCTAKKISGFKCFSEKTTCF